MEGTKRLFVSREEGNRYLVMTDNEEIVNKIRDSKAFENVQFFSKVDENGTTVGKVIELDSTAKNAYYVRKMLEVAGEIEPPKDEIDQIAQEMHVQRSTAIAVAFGAASIASTLKMKKALGDSFDSTVEKIKEIVNK